MNKILAIDDKKDNLITLSALLSNLMPDCLVSTALSGTEGIEKARTGQPDVILLDVKMPDMDGFETCRRLKTDDSTSAIPIIMITAIKTDSRSRIKGLDLGADAFLAKPIDEVELVSQVKVALRIKKAEDALRRERNSLEQAVHERTRELRENEHKYRLLFESAGDAIYIHDAEARMLAVNTTACELLGYTQAELLAMTIDRVDTPEEAQYAPERIARLMKQGHHGFQTVHRRKDGGLVPVEVRSRLINWGGQAAMMSICRDITERKRFESEREILITAERDMDNKLRQAQKMEAIGTLAGGIAHDFNNILGAIIGYTEMIRDDTLAGLANVQDINQVLNAGNRAKELVKQILAFGRQGESELIPVQPATIIKEALKLLRASLPTTITIQQNIDPEAGVILADPTHIHQIMMNLCTNAFHAMEIRGGTLTVSLHKKTLSPEDLGASPQLPPGNSLQLSIEDSGEGIAPEVLDKIFDPYFTTKEVGKGTGMGLSMVHGIVHSYGGTISCNSRLGEGTVFHITLPTVEQQSVQEVESPQLSPFGTEHILLVDDEEFLIEMGQMMLARLGYRVTTRMNSLEALTTFQNEPNTFDLVLCDQTMPGMTGEDLSRRLLQIRPDIPIILCTGYSSLISETKAKAMGIKGFALKPLTSKDLAMLIRQVLGKV